LLCAVGGNGLAPASERVCSCLEYGMPQARIVDIQIQPIKGGGAVKLSRARMTRSGLESMDGRVLDHSLFVVDARPNPDGDHSFITQRTRLVPSLGLHFPGSPKLALIRPSLGDAGLSFTFEGKDEVLDPGPDKDDPARAIPVRLFKYRGQALEVPVLSRWLTEHLGRAVSVVRTAGPWNRMTATYFMENNNPLRAQDGYPVHAVMLGDAEAAFAASGTAPDPNRFRYQLLLDGLPLWAIHDYTQVVVNGVKVCQAKPCDRCEVTAIDQNTGERSMIKPLAGLRPAGSPIWIRPDTSGRTRIMGESWIPFQETIVTVGDTVHFRGRRTDMNFVPGRKAQAAQQNEADQMSDTM